MRVSLKVMVLRSRPRPDERVNRKSGLTSYLWGMLAQETSSCRCFMQCSMLAWKEHGHNDGDNQASDGN
jgi:hypothetical protein